MKIFVTERTKILLFLILSFLIFDKGEAQNSASISAKCPPLIVPSLSYQIQGQVETSIGAEVNFHFVPKGCDCNGPWGGLCYLAGPTAGFRAQYYPDIEGLDIAGSYGLRIIFLKPEIVGGYTFVMETERESFFHIDPALGLDFLVGNLSVGYSFRTVKIENKIGSFYFRIAISPLVLSQLSRPRKVLSAYSKTSKQQRKNFKAAF